MELELKQESLDTYETGGDLILTQEENAETIVPDYCPDIARIITTFGNICLQRKELLDGTAEVSGILRVTVLYTPDGESGIRSLEFTMPFTAESEPHALKNCSYLTASAQVDLLETRILNPRKVFTHCKIITYLKGYQRSRLLYYTDLEDTKSVEKRHEKNSVFLLTQISEKDFTFTDTMNFSPGKEGAAELLHCEVSHKLTETKIVGNKLIFKGVFSATVLYRSTSGNYCFSGSELPFSQIMELDGNPDTASVSMNLQLTGSDFQIGDDPEGREISITLYFHASALLRQKQTLSLLCDLYSTAYDMSYDAIPITLTGFYETITRRQTVREVLEIGVVADSILSLSLRCGMVSVSRDKESTVLRTIATVCAMYLDEGNVPLVAERRIEVSCCLELPADCKITAQALCTEEVQGSIADRGIEVRFPVDFNIEASCQSKKVCISSANLNTDTQKDFSSTPSLVMRCLGQQESAWDLAKQYNTTIQTILAANELEREEDIPHEKLLLIPRIRE